MIRDISFQYPQWYLLLCLALGIAYATILYFRERKFSEQIAWLPWLLALLRTLAVSAIAMLLLSPIIKTITEDVKQPIVVVAKDVSSSVVNGLDDAALTKFNSEMALVTEQLSSQYDVRTISFGDQVSEGVRDSFVDKVTNISALISYIDDNYSDQNLGAVIMATDGIFNEGKNPLYVNANLTSPIYTIAMGDTSIRKDLMVKNVFHNKISYLGDRFIIQVDLSAFNCTGNTTVLTVAKEGNEDSQKLAEQRIRIDGNNFFKTSEITLDADETGVVKYRISASRVSGEITGRNNYKDIFVEVLDARQKILLLANAPHPDLSAIKQILTSNKNYDVDIKFAEDSDLNIRDYNLVVLHNLPSSRQNISAVLNQLNAARIPRLFIVGTQTDIAQFNLNQDVITVNGSGNSNEDVQASFNSSFAAYTSSPGVIGSLGQFPPLQAPFAQYSANATAKSVLKQQIKKIETEYPLLAYSEKDGYKTGVLVGEGIWRWRLFDFLKNSNYEITTEVLNKSIQYLSAKDDKRKFRVNSSKNIYKENESIYLDAQLYNDNYELINEPDVSVIIKDNAGKEYDYVFSKSNSYYVLNAGLFAEGNYSYEAQVNYDGNQYTDKGRLSVQSIQLESYDLTARHDILTALSDKYGGTQFSMNNLAGISNLLMGDNKLKPVIYQNTHTKSIINFKWLFYLLMGLLSIEWFIRRYFGSY